MTTPLEVKLLDQKLGVISGYAAILGNVDSHGDVLQPGAFAASIADHLARGTMPAMLWSHNQTDVPIGTWTSMREDAIGLLVEGKLNPAISRARDVLSALEAGSVTGLSIGFRTPPGGRTLGTKAGTFKLSRVDLVEISIVNFPSNTSARIVSTKSHQSIIDRIAAAAEELRNIQ